MADEFRPTSGNDIEYKAFARHFEHQEDDEERASVLYVIATLSKPDSGYRFLIVEQAGEPDVWRFFEDKPAHVDGDRTYYIASGLAERPIDEVPRSIVVLDANGSNRVSVVPWD